MTNEQIIDAIKAFGFQQKSDNADFYYKIFGEINYQLSVDFLKNRIDFGLKIKKGDETTSNLQNAENIVVLECVNRLIEKGYLPEDLTLEKKWKLGRLAKGGKADITVKGKDEKTLLIIECKTWGKEYEKELDRMKANGGQLFSYFQQDKNTRFLCLYASKENKGKIEKANALIKVEDTTDEKIRQLETEKLITYEQAKTIKEMLEVWKYKTKGKQTVARKGLFEHEIEPYNPGYEPIKIADLKEFGEEDKGKVFNQFEEILRHHNISDRSNAFNRTISLIFAKIVDEEKRGKAIADFQIKEGIDDAETLLERLQSLYSRAMKDYLHEEVIDHTLKDIEAQINHFPRQTAKDTLYRIYKELKFYQNNEFAFKEVYNKKLFEDNAKVLEEVVRLFQHYRFKYQQKAQFLGDFFEQLLESGYKQTEGQFFTPTPIAKFIISSLPLKELIFEKLENGERLFLPKVIDFACGSGHFLTEAIEEIATLIENLNEKDFENLENNFSANTAQETLKEYKKNMKWAGQYIYGIEKDYRLARTSQVACFMHGDGDANIIFGDGLEQHSRLSKDGTFDVLIANPPYTIKDFKKHLKVVPHRFEMWEHVTQDSDDIEVFFIERMKQLLRPGGMAGIILPSSILSNTGPYTKAREIILKHFEIKAIVEFGGVTFGATNTNTVTLYLKKRHENFSINCLYIAEDFISENIERNLDFVNSQALYEKYIAHLKLKFEDYKTFTSRKPNKNITESEFYKNYRNWFKDLTEIKKLKEQKTFLALKVVDQKKRLESIFFDYVLEIETEKFFHYLLAHREVIFDKNEFEIEEIISEDENGNEVITRIKHFRKKFVTQNTLICKTGNSTKEQQQFLGYKFSKRRGNKGIDFSGDTKMFDKNNNQNPKKVNYYIQQNFQDLEFSIEESLQENLNQVQLLDCINFEKIDFDKRINLVKTERIKIPSNAISLKSIVNINTTSINPKDNFGNSLFTYVDIDAVGKGTGTIDYSKKIKGNDAPSRAKRIASEDSILISTVRPNLKGFAYLELVESDVIFSTGFAIIKSKPNSIYSSKFLYFCFMYSDLLMKQMKLKMGKATYPSINKTDIENLKIPKLSEIEIRKIIQEVEKVEQKEKDTKKQKETVENLINQKIIEKTKVKKVKDILKLSPSKSNPLDNPDEFFNYIGLEHIESNTGQILFWKPSVGASIKSTKNKFKKGELLYGKLRPYLNKVAIPDFNGICSTDILVLQTDYPLIVKRLLLSNEFVRKASNKMGGVSLPRIKVKDFLELSISFPLEPQKIENEISKLERQIKKLQQSIANTETEKKSILTKYLEK